jgi:hypothetical protein
MSMPQNRSMMGSRSCRLMTLMAPVLLYMYLVAVPLVIAGTTVISQVENTATVTYADLGGFSYDEASNLVITPVVAGEIGTNGVISQQSRIVAGFYLDIAVEDSDLNISTTEIDTVRVETVNDRTGEKEYPHLLETGINTGVFTGTLPTYYNPSAGPAGNGILFAQPSDILISSYIDVGTVDGIVVVRDARTLVSATQISLISSPSVIVANGSDVSLLTARVTDGMDDPLPDGTIVLFTTDKGSFDNGIDRIEVPISGGDGQAVATLIAPVLASSDTARAIASFAGFDSDEIGLEVLPGALAVRVFDQVRNTVVASDDPSLSVQVVLTGTTVVGDFVEFNITVDRSGLFIVPEIPPGSYEFNALVVEKTTGRVVYDGVLQQITVQADGSVSPPNNAVTGMVHGRGESTGARYAGLETVLINELGTVSATTTLDGDGQYVFDDIPPGSYSIQVRMPDGTTLNRSISERSIHVGEIIVNADVLIDPFGRAFDSETGTVIPGVTITLQTLSGETLPIPALSGTGAPPNLDNANPFVTTSDGRYAFLFGASQVGTPTKPAQYIMAVDPPSDTSYPPRRMYISVRPSSEVTGKVSVTSRGGRTAAAEIIMDVIPADGLELALPNSFTLTSDVVTVPNIETIAFNIPLFPKAPVLTLNKFTQTDSVCVGESADFGLIVSNIGNETASAVTLLDTLGTMWRLMETDATTITRSILRWELGDIAPGGTDTLHVSAAATSAASASGDLTNTGWIQHSSGLPTYSTAKVAANDTPDITVVKRANTQSVALSEQIQYDIEIAMSSSYLGTLDVHDPLSDALDYVAGSSNPGIRLSHPYADVDSVRCFRHLADVLGSSTG